MNLFVVLSRRAFAGLQQAKILAVSAALLTSSAGIAANPEGNATVGAKFGSSTGEAYLSIFSPLSLTPDSVVFLNPRIAIKEEGANEGNLGLGMRKVLPGGKAIIGANIYYDSTRSKYGNRFNQWGAGLELLSESVDARINYYKPGDDKPIAASVGVQDVADSVDVSQSSRTNQSVERTLVDSSDQVSERDFYQGNEIVNEETTVTTDTYQVDTTTTTTTTTTRTNTRTFTDMTLEKREGGLEGFDAEIGYKLPLGEKAPETRLFLGYYDFDGPFGTEFKGAKGRLEMRANDYLTLDAEYFEDEELHDTNYYLGVRVNLPFSFSELFSGRNPFKTPNAKKLPRTKQPLYARLGEEVIRDVNVHVAESPFQENLAKRKVRKETTSVSTSESSSSQTQTTTETEVATNVDSEAYTSGGDTITVTHVDSNEGGSSDQGTFENPNTTLTSANNTQTTQQNDIILIHADSSYTGETVVVTDDQSLIGQGGGITTQINTDQGMLTLPEANAGGGAVATINNGGVQINSNNVLVNNLTLDGGSITTAPGGAHSNLTISNITVTNAIADAISLGAGGGTLDGNIVLNNISVQGTTGNDLVMENLLGSAVVTGTGITLDGASGDGLFINNSAAGSQFTFTDLMIMNSGDRGVDLSNADGIFAFNNTDITDTADDAFSVDNGAANVTLDAASSITQGQNASALRVNTHTGTLTVDGTIAATDGNGLRFNNADGTYNLNGTNTLNGGNAGIDIINGSAGTFNFADTDITSPTGRAINISDSTANVTVGAASSITQANSSDTIRVINHSGGTVTINGTINSTNGQGLDFSNADGTYNIAGATTLNGGNAGVDIRNGSAGTFTFTDTDITSPTGRALDITDSTANVTFGAASSITQANNSDAIRVENHSAGTVAFNGTINATNGNGLQFDNAAGTYNITGTATLNGGNAGVDIGNGSSGTFTFTDTDITSPTGRAVDISDSTANVTFGAASSITQANNSDTVRVINHSGGTVAFNGSINATNGNGLQFNNADGTYNLAGSNTLNGGNAAIDITNGSAGTFTFTDTDISNPTGTAFNLTDSTANVTFGAGSTISQGNAARVVNIDNHNTGTVIFNGAVSATNGNGIRIRDADGTYTFNQATNISGGGNILVRDSDGTITFSDITVNGASGDGILIRGGSSTFMAGTTNVSGAGDAGILIRDTTGGSVTFGDTTITTPTNAGIELNNNAGNIAFGETQINNPGVSGVEFNGTSTGTVGFTGLTVALETDNSTALDMRGATINGNVTMGDFDVTSTTAVGTTGVNLAGTTGTGGIQLGDSAATGESSSIAGVNDGFLFSSTTNVTMAFGDGEGLTDTGSTISAVTPINHDGSGLPSNGSYDFDDVQFTGDTSNIAGPSIYYVDQNAGGAGTEIDPGTIAGAEASSADVIVLLDTDVDGVPDLIDISSPAQGSDTSFNLDDGQVLISFALGDASIDVAAFGITAGAPSAFSFTTINTSTVIDAPTSGIDSVGPILTTTGANDTVIVEGSGVISNVTIDNGGSGDAVSIAPTVDGTVVISNSDLTGGDSALDVDDNGQNVELVLNNNTYATTATGTGNVVDINGSGAGSVVISDFTNQTVNGDGGETGGIVINTVTFDGNTAVAGNQTVGGGNTVIGTTGTRVNGDALSLTNVTGDLSFTDLDIANDGGTGLEIKNPPANVFTLTTAAGTIDTTNGSAIDIDPVTVNLTLDSVSSTNATGNGLNFEDVLGSVTINGPVNVSGAGGDGIHIENSAATFNFNGLTTVSGSTGEAVDLIGPNGAVTFANVNLSGAAGTTGLQVTNATNNVTVTTGSITNGVVIDGGNNAVNVGANVSTASGYATEVTNRTGGTVTFGGTVTSSTGSVNVNNNSGGTVTFNNTVTGTGSPVLGAINIGANTGGIVDFNSLVDIDVTGAGIGVNIAALDASTVSFDGGLDITSVNGTGFNVLGGTVSVANAATESIVTTGTAGAININGATVGAGGINFDSVSTAATATSDGVHIENTTGGAINLANVNLDSTAGNSGLEIVNAGNAVNVTAGTIGNGVLVDGNSGTVAIGANVSATSGNAVQVSNRTGGTVTVSGTVNGSDGAVNLSGNSGGTVTFSNTVTGTGSSAGGAVRIANNTGGIFNFNGLVDIDTTGTGAGVVMDTNAGATVNFAGGLDIDTVAGTGFAATGGGTLNITGANSIDTGTGQILNLDNIVIGGSGVTFNTLRSTGSVTTGNAVNLNAVSGGTFNGGNVTVAGTLAGDGVHIANSSAAMMFTSFDIDNVSGNGIQITAAANGGNSGNFSVSGLTDINGTGAGQAAINVDNMAGSLMFGNVNINNRGGAGININAFNDGTQDIDFGTVTINNQNSSATTALAIDNINGAGSTVDITSVAIDNNAANASAIALSNNDGATINISGGSVTNAAGAAVSISSSSGTATYAGTINNTAGRSVQVLNNENGGVVNLTGAITDTGTGVFINNNDQGGGNATVNISGGMTLNTGSDTAFTATNGGVINVTGTNRIGNTSAVTSRAIRIADTLIGSSGVTFATVNANGAGGGNTGGIFVRNTGSVAGSFFTVNGGTIQNSEGANLAAGATSATGDGIGVYLENVQNATLSGVTVTNSQNFGVRGFGLLGTTNLTNTTVNGAHGNAAASDESAVALDNISGTLNVTGGSYSGGHEDTFAITNNTGTVTANFTGTTFGTNNATFGDNGLQFVTSGTATGNLNVNNSNFNGARAVMLFVDAGGSGGGDINIGNTTGNNFTQGQVNLPGGGAIEVIASGSGNASTVDTNISNNVILAGANRFEGDTVVVGTGFGYAGTHNITLNNNRIGTNGVNGSAVNAASGSGDSGLVITQNGTGTINALVTNNNIFDFNAAGIEVIFDAEGPSDPNGGALNLTVSNNTITEATGGSLASIDILGDDNVDTCINITGNTLSNPTDREIVIDVFGAAGATFRVPGLGTLTEAGIEALWAANNGGLTPTTDVRVFSLAPSTISGGGACTQP